MKQDEITLFDTEDKDCVWKAAFDDKMGKAEIRILVILLSRVGSDKPHLFSTRAISLMIGLSQPTTSRAIKNLINSNYVVNINNNYYLNGGNRFKNESEVIQKRIGSDSKMNQKRFKNESTIIQNNNTKNKKEEGTSNEAQHTHINDQIDVSKKAPKLNMKDQLKGAKLVTDDKGKQSLVLPNGSKQIKSYPNIFLLPSQYVELQKTYDKEFSELSPHKYLKWALNRLNEWIDQNPAKANKYMGHFKVLNDGWVLSAAKVEYNIDLRNDNIKNSMNRGNRE